MKPDAFERELEAEVAKVLDPGTERRRQVAVRDLHTATGASLVGRLAMVTVGIAVIVLVVWLAGIALGLDLLAGM